MAHLSRYASGSTSTWSRLSFTHNHTQFLLLSFHLFNLHTLFITHNLVCYPITYLAQAQLCLLYLSLFWHQSIELAIPTHSSFFLKSNGSFLLFLFSAPNLETVQGHLQVVIKCLTSVFDSDFHWDNFMFSNSNVKLTLLEALNNDGPRRTALCLSWSWEWVFRKNQSELLLHLSNSNSILLVFGRVVLSEFTF